MMSPVVLKPSKAKQRVQDGGDSIVGDSRFHHNLYPICGELFRSESRSRSEVRVSGFVGGLFLSSLLIARRPNVEGW